MLKVDSLFKAYGQHQVLNGLSFTINQGEIYGLLGPNGAGKTTTINIICNLLQADSGTIELNQQSISNATKSWIGVAPQENLLYKSLSCAENLHFYAQIYGLDRQTRQQRVEQSLKAVHLWDRSHTVVENLSGGMQRRVNIAAAIVHQPKLVILDEPTTGLDIEARYEIWQLIVDLSRTGTTILLTTHLLDEAARLCGRIGILKGGKIVADGSLAQLQSIVPAQEIITVKTQQEQEAIAVAQTQGWQIRKYGSDLAFLLPNTLELSDFFALFAGIKLDSIARKSVELEHIYLEATQDYNPDSDGNSPIQTQNY